MTLIWSSLYEVDMRYLMVILGLFDLELPLEQLQNTQARR